MRMTYLKLLTSVFRLFDDQYCTNKIAIAISFQLMKPAQQKS